MAWFRRDNPFDDFLKSVLEDAKQSVSDRNNNKYMVKPSGEQSSLTPYRSSPDTGYLLPSELQGLPLDTLDYRKYQIGKQTRDEVIAIEVTIYRGKLR